MALHSQPVNLLLHRLTLGMYRCQFITGYRIGYMGVMGVFYRIRDRIPVIYQIRRAT